MRLCGRHHDPQTTWVISEPQAAHRRRTSVSNPSYYLLFASCRKRVGRVSQNTIGTLNTVLGCVDTQISRWQYIAPATATIARMGYPSPL